MSENPLKICYASISRKLFDRYSISKYVAVVMVTIGIVMATMASANQMVGAITDTNTYIAK